MQITQGGPACALVTESGFKPKTQESCLLRGEPTENRARGDKAGGWSPGTSSGREPEARPTGEATRRGEVGVARRRPIPQPPPQKNWQTQTDNPQIGKRNTIRPHRPRTSSCVQASQQINSPGDLA